MTSTSPKSLPTPDELPPTTRCGWPFDEGTPPPSGNVEWPRITLVIPSYEQAEYLEETLRSVILQAYPELELLVVDGGSEDGTVEILERYDPWITWWTSEPDRGQSHAINKGFARATGEIITFLGSDDVYEPGTLFDVARRYLDDPSWGALVGAFQLLDLSSERLGEPIPPRLPDSDPRDLALLDPGSWRLHQVSAFYSRHALDAVGRRVEEDLHYTMDRELLYRVARRFPVVLASETYGLFRRHPDSKSVAAILPMSREMGDLHLRDVPPDAPRTERRRRRRHARHHRARGYLKLASASASEGRRLRSLWALLFALRHQPGLIWRHHYARRWLESLVGPSGSRVIAAAMLGVIGLSLALKIAVVAGSWGQPDRFLTNDSLSYLRPAAALAAEGRFTLSPTELDRPETLRTPGYPLFLALVARIADLEPPVVALAQAAVSSATLLLVYSMGRIVGDPRVGFLAASLLALDVASFAFSLKVLSETLFACLLVACWPLARGLAGERPGVRWAAALGIASGAAVLIRPVAYYLVIPMATWVLWTGRRQREWRVSGGLCLAFLAGWALLVGGWQLRNLVQTGEPILSRIQGKNLLFYRGASVLALRDDVSLDEAQRRIASGEYPGIDAGGVGESPEAQAAGWSREGLSILAAHPTLSLRLQAEGLASMMFGVGHHALWDVCGMEVPQTSPLGDSVEFGIVRTAERWTARRPGLLAAFLAEQAHLLILYLGSAIFLVTLARSWRRRSTDDRATLLWGWIVVSYLILVSAGPEANARFRVPFAPILAVFAAMGWCAAWRWFRCKTAPRGIPSPG